MLIKWIFKREPVVTTIIKDFGIISVVSLRIWIHLCVGCMILLVVMVIAVITRGRNNLLAIERAARHNQSRNHSSALVKQKSTVRSLVSDQFWLSSQEYCYLIGWSILIHCLAQPASQPSQSCHPIVPLRVVLSSTWDILWKKNLLSLSLRLKHCSVLAIQTRKIKMVISFIVSSHKFQESDSLALLILSWIGLSWNSYHTGRADAW